MNHLLCNQIECIWENFGFFLPEFHYGRGRLVNIDRIQKILKKMCSELLGWVEFSIQLNEFEMFTLV